MLFQEIKDLCVYVDHCNGTSAFILKLKHNEKAGHYNENRKIRKAHDRPF